jgi:uncharacterized membrane protein YidH (DUF202 family)
MDDEERVLDPGLQAERTRLSWSRTALALVVIGALMLHPFGRQLTVRQSLPGLTLLLFAGLTWWYGGWRYRRVLVAVREGRSAASTWEFRAFTWLCLLPAAVAIWAVLT